MTTPPGQEPRPGTSRGRDARSRRGGDPGWPAPGDAGPHFTPARAADGAPPRERGRSQGGRGYGERASGGRAGADRRSRDRTDARDSPRRPADRGGPRDDTGRGGPRSGGSREASGLDVRAGPLLRWIGTFSVQRALAIFFGAAALGALATLVSGEDPGSLLGNLITAGSVIAALGIRRRALYLLIPLPALTYLALALLTGAIHDSGNDGSTAQLGLNFLQWIGNGFFSLCAATILVLLIFGGRLLASRQLVSGSFPMSAQRPAAGRPARPLMSPGGRPDPRREDRRRPARAPWDAPDPWYDQGPRDQAPWNERDQRSSPARPGPRDRRDGRDNRDDRDRRDQRGERSMQPGRAEPSTRALPPGRNPRQARDSRPPRDSRDERGYRGRGAPPGNRGPWDDR